MFFVCSLLGVYGNLRMCMNACICVVDLKKGKMLSLSMHSSQPYTCHLQCRLMSKTDGWFAVDEVNS